MIEDDLNNLLINLSWCVIGGELIIARNGHSILSISSKGSDPELDILDIDALKVILPPINLNFLEKITKISRSLSKKGKNLKVSSHGALIINLGTKARALNSAEKLAAFVLEKTTKRFHGKKSKH